MMEFDVLSRDSGPVYMVSRTRDNPPPEVTLGELILSPVSLKSSTNRLHEDHQLVSGRRDNSGGELSHLGR